MTFCCCWHRITIAIAVLIFVSKYEVCITKYEMHDFPYFGLWRSTLMTLRRSCVSWVARCGLDSENTMPLHFCISYTWWALMHDFGFVQFHYERIWHLLVRYRHHYWHHTGVVIFHSDSSSITERDKVWWRYNILNKFRDIFVGSQFFLCEPMYLITLKFDYF